MTSCCFRWLSSQPFFSYRRRPRGGSEVGATTVENLLYLLQYFSTLPCLDHAFSNCMTIGTIINCFSRKLIYYSLVSNQQGLLISLNQQRGWKILQNELREVFFKKFSKFFLDQGKTCCRMNFLSSCVLTIASVLF